MADPYRTAEAETRSLQPDHAPRRRVRQAAVTTALLGASIGATTPVLGPLAAVLGGAIALLGVALLREGGTTAMKAPCPSCGAEIGDIDPAVDVVRCPSCREYVGCRGGSLVPLRDDYVAASPVFAVPVGPDLAPPFAPLCAECGGLATRRVPVALSAASLGRAPDALAAVVHVPHCDAHANGADAWFANVRLRSRALWLGTQDRRALAS